MRRCKCIVLDRISNGNTTFHKDDVVSVQFYKYIDTCDVYGVGENRGVITSVSKSKVEKLYKRFKNNKEYNY